MSSLSLVIANKNYSSWSLRAWLALRQSGLAFDEILVPLDLPETRAELLKHSPTGKAPCLIDGAIRVWESLAILEYLAERFPDARLWPAAADARALARAISAEMHAGFGNLRSTLPMNLRRKVARLDTDDATRADVARIEALWRDARRRFGEDGPFLFGSFTAADAMYAPVATRLHTYDIPIAHDTRVYVDTILGLPAFKEWTEAALAEPWVVDADEVD